ncbi:MAG: hypothetical protein ACRC6U_07805 [Fusobacteriaceae bacterium]
MKKKLVVTMFFLTIITSYSFNLGIAPTSFNLDLNRSQTKEVTILNNTESVMRVEVFAEKPEDTEDSKYLGEYIRVYPKIVNVRPFGKQVVKFAVRIPKELEVGDYKSYLVFKELPGKPSESLEDKKTTKLNITMLTEIAITIYGTKK